MRRPEQSNFKTSVWGKLMMMMSMMFFLYLGDAILSDWAPSYMQKVLGGSLLMGIMMSFSSLLGFVADLVFPQMFKTVNSRRMIVLAISSVFMTAGTLLWTTHFPYPAIFLLGMGIWGLYYEFLTFGISQFVAKNASVETRAGVWSMVGVFKSIAYTLGPLIGSWLYIMKGDMAIIFIYAGFALLSYVVWLIMGILQSKGEKEMEIEKFYLLDEIKHWGTLFEHVWPILLVSLTLGIIDAAFWTTGVVLSDRLVQTEWIGSLFVPAYMLPSIFIGFLVARLKIYKHKKKLAEFFMLLVGIFTIGLGMNGSTLIMVGLALMIGVASAIAWPLVDAVYSDIQNRMGREQKHVIGISSSTVNLSYITGPVVAGFLSSKIGEEKTLMIIGLFVVIVSVILLIVTPKKLRLPQNEIKKWE